MTSIYNDRLGLVGDSPTPILPGSARLDQLYVSNLGMTVSGTGSAPSTPGFVLTNVDDVGTVEWRDARSVINCIIYRLNVDPQSNPDPNIGGLMIDSADTVPGPYNIPLTDQDQGLDLGNAFVQDPYNSFTLNVVPGVGATSFTCNRRGFYQFSIEMPLLGMDNLSTGIIQLLRNGQQIFTAPPAINCIAAVDIPVTGFGGGMLPFATASNFGSISACELQPGDELALVLAVDTGTITIPMTSNLYILGVN